MIKVTYKDSQRQSTIYDGTNFYFVNGNPFVKSGLYIKDDDKIIAFINDVEVIHKVEWLNKNDPYIIFSFCSHLKNYQNKENSPEETLELIEEDLKEYFDAKFSNVDK